MNHEWLDLWLDLLIAIYILFKNLFKLHNLFMEMFYAATNRIAAEN